MENNLGISQINVERIEDVSDVLEICNDQRKIFCFTVTFKNYEILNVLKIFNSFNRNEIEKEINQEHEKLLNRIENYKNNQ